MTHDLKTIPHRSAMVELAERLEARDVIRAMYINGQEKEALAMTMELSRFGGDFTAAAKLIRLMAEGGAA